METINHHPPCNNLLCIWSLLSYLIFIFPFTRLNKQNSFIPALETMLSEQLIICIIYDKLSPISVSSSKSVSSPKSAHGFNALITFWNGICLFYKWRSVACVSPASFLHFPSWSLHISYSCSQWTIAKIIFSHRWPHWHP